MLPAFAALLREAWGATSFECTIDDLSRDGNAYDSEWSSIEVLLYELSSAHASTSIRFAITGTVEFEAGSAVPLKRRTRRARASQTTGQRSKRFARRAAGNN